MPARRRGRNPNTAARDRMIIRLAYNAPYLTHAQIGDRTGASRSTVMRVLAARRRGSVHNSYPARHRRLIEDSESRSLNWRVQCAAAAGSDIVLRRHAAAGTFYALHRIAAIPGAHPAALRTLAEHPTEAVRAASAGNPRCPQAVIARCALHDPIASVNIAAARNPSCPRAVIDAAARTDNHDIRGAAASNPSCPPRTLAGLLDDPEIAVRAAAASNPNCGPGTVAAFAADRDYRVRAAAAANPRCPPAVLDALAVSDATVAAAASNPSARPELLRSLARRREPAVKRAVALNRSTPQDALDELASAGGIVTQRVASNASTSVETLHRIADDPKASQRARGCASRTLRAVHGLTAA